MHCTLLIASEDTSDPSAYRDKTDHAMMDWTGVMASVRAYQTQGFAVEHDIDYDNGMHIFRATGGPRSVGTKRYSKTLYVRSRARKSVEDMFRDLIDNPEA